MKRLGQAVSMLSSLGLTLFMSQACAEEIKPVVSRSDNQAATTIHISNHSREKSYHWRDITINNPYGDRAFTLSNFTLTVLEETPERGNPVTKIVINYDQTNYTENDQEPNPNAHFILSLLDKSDQLLLPNVLNYQIMRSHCTYGGPEHTHIGPNQLSNNLYDVIDGGSLDVFGASGKEGGC